MGVGTEGVLWNARDTFRTTGHSALTALATAPSRRASACPVRLQLQDSSGGRGQDAGCLAGRFGSGVKRIAVRRPV